MGGARGGAGGMSVYVEIRIRGTLDDLWRLSQTPHLHARWDLRFSEIEYLPRPDESQPQRFLYATRIGFGLAIRGHGETVGERDGACGERTSALKFWSEDPRSLIREGAGYWRYVPEAEGVRFFTGYDYRVRYGLLGRVVDRFLFRPLLGWATAWSFDRLRLWIERRIEPEVSLQRSLVHLVARLGVGFVWVYQGAVPKLLERHTDELLLLRYGGVPAASAPIALQVAGWGEVIFGLAVLLFFHQRWHFLLTILLMIGATAGVVLVAPRYLGAAFNPVSLNVLMAALAGIGLLVSRDLPSSRRCLRRPPKEER